jgi:hypothetical protein
MVFTVSKITIHYFKAFFLILFSVLFVVTSFQSFLYFLKISHFNDPFSEGFLLAFFETLLLIPLKISDFFPLAVYISLGITHYLWKKKSYWLAATLVGFNIKDLAFLKVLQFLFLFFFSASLSWFIAPQCAALKLENQKNVSFFDLEKNYLDGQKLYQFSPNNTVDIIDFNPLSFSRGTWGKEGDLIIVDGIPIVNTKIIEEERKQFYSVSLNSKVSMFKRAPQSQQKTMAKTLMFSILNPLCVLLSLCLGWIIFSIDSAGKFGTLLKNSPLHIGCCALVFLLQHLLSDFFFLPWKKLLIFFYSVILFLFIFLLLLDKRLRGIKIL